MTELEMYTCIAVALVLLVLVLVVGAVANKALEKIDYETERRRAALDRADGDRVRNARNFSALCDHLGVTIVQEPSRTVVRVKGSPEKGE